MCTKRTMYTTRPRSTTRSSSSLAVYVYLSKLIRQIFDSILIISIAQTIEFCGKTVEREIALATAAAAALCASDRMDESGTKRTDDGHPIYLPSARENHLPFLYIAFLSRVCMCVLDSNAFRLIVICWSRCHRRAQHTSLRGIQFPREPLCLRPSCAAAVTGDAAAAAFANGEWRIVVLC